MLYVSTRGKAPPVTFKEALLAGLASDGGLYVPQSWPVFSPEEIAAFRGQSYSDVALAVMEKFIGDEIARDELKAMIAAAYASFHHPVTAPLVQFATNSWLLELFHGPTLAFKDVAMQILARLMDHVLAERGEGLTIVGATSGDTGGAAFEAFKSCATINMFFMFPDGRVSDFQRRQMTTIDAANCHAIAIEGTFDDCQSMVKAMFSHDEFRRQTRLSAVNSINTGRVIAQIVYYFTSAVALGAPQHPVSFTVPTGNFGDIYAGFVAKKMGLPIDKLVVATNENDILVRTIETGDHSLGVVKPTITPSMDIQVSSNFERLIFEASQCKADVVADLMTEMSKTGRYILPDNVRSTIRGDFAAGRASESEILATIKHLHATTGYICDPHTAVAVHVACQHADPAVPMIVLSTAHPVKFPDAVSQAIGKKPELPDWADANQERNEVVRNLPNDIAVVEAHIISQITTGNA